MTYLPADPDAGTPAYGAIAPPSSVPGLDETETGQLVRMVVQWQAKRERNKTKTEYWEGKHRLDHIGFSIPPALKDLAEVVGWPAKAVQAHAERCMFDGFVSSNDSTDPFNLRKTLTENRFDIELPQAITSAMIHSCSFISVTTGQAGTNDPDITVMAHSAQWATGLWNPRARELDAALVVTGFDDYGAPDAMTMYTRTDIINLARVSGSWKVRTRDAHRLGRVPVETLVYRPSLDRPFGRSVISRAVMSITDDAMRTVLRTECTAEFYSSPYLMLMGADPDSFTDDNNNPIPMWDFVMGHINMVSKDEDGDVPTLEKISAQSIQPHIEQMRELACRFAGETSVPVSSLGVVTDNPSSAQAMHAAEKDLVIDCAAANRSFGAALRRIGQDIVLMRDGGSMTDELASLSVRWRNPALPSVVDAGDSMVKLVSAFPWLADTTVALEEVGFTDEQIVRIMSDKRRAQARSVLDTLVQKEMADGREGRQDSQQGGDQRAGGQPTAGGGAGETRAGQNLDGNGRVSSGDAS